METTWERAPSPQRGEGWGEGGAALILALVLMAALTVLGLTAVTLSTVEVRIAQNDFNMRSALDAAEGGLQVGIEHAQQFPGTDASLASGSGLPVNYSVNVSSTEKVVSPPPGYSLDYISRVYEIESTGSLTSGGTQISKRISVEEIVGPQRASY